MDKIKKLLTTKIKRDQMLPVCAGMFIGALILAAIMTALISALVG